MNPQRVKTMIITTVNGEEYHYSGDRANDLYNAYKGAVENRAPWIYTESGEVTNIFQIQHIANIHVRHGESDA